MEMMVMAQHDPVLRLTVRETRCYSFLGGATGDDCAG
jgi:hypothetical protein